METFVVIQGSSFTSIYVHIRPFTSIDVAIDVDRHRHLHNFTSIYVNLRPFTSIQSLIPFGDFCHEGEGGVEGWILRDTMVKTKQKPITLKSMICWSKNV